MNILAAHTDNALRKLAEAGDKPARDELVRRGIVSAPAKNQAPREFIREKPRRFYR